MIGENRSALALGEIPWWRTNTMNTTSDKIDVAAETPQLLTHGPVTLGTISHVPVLEPSQIFCVKDGIIMQLWYAMYSNDLAHREWRPLQDFAKASVQYECQKVVG